MKKGTSPTFVGSNYRITVYSERLVRLEYSANGNFFDGHSTLVNNRAFPDCNVEVAEEGNSLILKSHYFTLQYNKGQSFFGTKLFPDANLRIQLNETDKIWFPGNAEVRNFKLNGFSLNEKSKYFKSLYSTDGFAMVNDTNTIVFDEKGNIKARDDGNIDMYVFMYRRDFALCLQDFFRLTGFPELLPKYALGIWWNRDRIYTADDAHMLVNLFSKYDIPISVFLLSEFWHLKNINNPVAKKSGYSFSTELFSDPSQFISSMNDKNIKVGLNFDPSEGINPLDEVYPLFDNGSGTVVPFNAFDVVFANKFYEGIIAPLNIVDFLWVDFTSDLMSMKSLNYYVKKSRLKSRFLTLTRNTGLGSHKYPVLYSGQTTVSWKTLDSLPKYNAGASNYGLSWWSHDVGGFKDGVEESELYTRYVQFSTFSPIFRFSAKRGPYYKREPWLWDIKTMMIVKSYCDLRYRLIPYIYSEGYKYSTTGAPLCMPLYYNDPQLYDETEYKNEYKFGSELLLAPITKPMNTLINRSIHKVFLPQGIWYDFKSGKKFMGNKRYVTFYKDEEYPYFAKAGAIIPLAVLPSKKNDLSNPTTLEVNVFPGLSNMYRMYEDDGETLDYKNGDFCTTVFDFNYKKNNFSLIVRPADGRTGIIPDLRNYIIKFRNIKIPQHFEIFVNGGRYDKYDMFVEDNNLVVRIYEVVTNRQLTIVCGGEDIEIDSSRILNDDINSIIFDLKIDTNLKEDLASIIFSDKELRVKRIEINKLRRKGLNSKFASMFLKLLDYNS